MARRLVRGTLHVIFEGDRLHNEGGGHFLSKIQPIACEGGGKNENEIPREGGATEFFPDLGDESDLFPDTEASIFGDESPTSYWSYLLGKRDAEKIL
ncbi:Hypothetical predicted protein [Olea europaea subsp. europaea]|uniref:Uncharacterized protein n=1 Tax=Olea europaea subsp. europaea TaxID=158383 RepID=A0A8S0UHG9_OLEEU|nr:Hypothetical predicted protein [Olea europaea subsp. europaea]